MLIGVVVADHFSEARHAELEPGDQPSHQPQFTPTASGQPAWAGGVRTEPIAPRRSVAAETIQPAAPLAPLPEPIVIANGPSASGSESGSGQVRSGLLSEVLSRSSGVRPLLERETTSPGTSAAQTGGSKARSSADLADTTSRSVAQSATLSARYVTYRVQSGDTLYGLAVRVFRNGNRWRELRDLNKGKIGPDGALVIGMELKLPASAATSRPGTQAAPRKSMPAPREPLKRSRDRKYYIVKRGDTLGLIAQRELGTVRRQGDLLNANASRIRNADEIYVGMKLELPG